MIRNPNGVIFDDKHKCDAVYAVEASTAHISYYPVTIDYKSGRESNNPAIMDVKAVKARIVLNKHDHSGLSQGLEVALGTLSITDDQGLYDHASIDDWLNENRASFGSRFIMSDSKIWSIPVSEGMVYTAGTALEWWKAIDEVLKDPLSVWNDSTMRGWSAWWMA
jgi:hypothetical protein